MARSGEHAATAAGVETPLWRLPAMRRLALVSFLSSASFTLMLSSVPLWLVQHGAGTAAAGVPTTVMLAATVATQPAIPALVARFGSGRILAAGVLAMGLPAPAYAISTQLATVLPVSAVRGCGFGAMTVIASALTATIAAPERHGESVGVYGLATALPGLLGVPAGVALTQAGGFAWASALAAFAVLAAPAALRLGPSGPSGASGPSGVDARARATETSAPAAAVAATRTHAAAVRRAALPSVVLFVMTFAGGGLTTFLPIAQRTGQLATTALLAFGLTGVVVRWRVGRVADRIGAATLLPASVVVGAAGLLLVAAGLRGWWHPAAHVLVAVGAGLFGIGYGAVQNLTIVIAFARAGPGRTSTASAVWNAAFDAGTGLGAVAVGQLAASGLGFSRAFGLTGVLVVGAVPLALAARRPRRPLPP